MRTFLFFSLLYLFFSFFKKFGSTVSGFSAPFAVHFSSFGTRSYAHFPSLFPHHHLFVG